MSANAIKPGCRAFVEKSLGGYLDGFGAGRCIGIIQVGHD